MATDRRLNRKLLVSVFNAQEAREAILGGGRIIDSEDPRSALGNIKPRQIMTISDAVLNYRRDLEVQLSTNIGEDQLLYKRSDTGQAIQKSPYEITGKASQAALGVACSMGTHVHPCNIVKVGVDGMTVDLVTEVLTEVVQTLHRTEQFNHCQVMGVLFAQDLRLWNERKRHSLVRSVLVELREFHPAEASNPDSFDLAEYAVNTLRDQDGAILFTERDQVSLTSLQSHGVLPDDARSTTVALNELFPHSQYFPDLAISDKTTKNVIKVMVDATANAGASAMMLDTQIQTKVARICMVDTASNGLIDINRYEIASSPDLPLKGILPLDALGFFVDYCHYKGIEANVAGSVRSYQAQQLWVAAPQLDHISTRGESSAVEINPAEPGSDGLDTRQHRVIKRTLVRGLAAPEHGGVLNLPVEMRDNPEALKAIGQLREQLQAPRAAQDLPPIECYWVDKFGVPMNVQ